MSSACQAPYTSEGVPSTSIRCIYISRPQLLSNGSETIIVYRFDLEDAGRDLRRRARPAINVESLPAYASGSEPRFDEKLKPGGWAVTGVPDRRFQDRLVPGVQCGGDSEEVDAV